VELIARYDIPQKYFDDIADGCWSLERRLRYATWASLQTDLQATAGNVALAIAAVLGVQSSDAGAKLVKLAAGAVLVELLRSVREDFARDHVRLPLEDLARFRCAEGTLKNGVDDELLRFEIDRARSLIQEGAEGVCWLADYRARLFASTIAVNSARLLDEMKDERTSGLWMWRGVPRALRLARRPSDEPLAKGW
jgi:phytoene synthase